MIVEDQSRTFEFLADPSSHYGTLVERMETHISEIFLAGDRAYKLKRAVKLPYVDFSTSDLRMTACQEEVRRNILTAPNLYLGVRLITREADGALAFDGKGSLVDAVVEMVRFDQSGLLDCLAVEGKLSPSLLESLASKIARFHRNAPVVHRTGGYEIMKKVLAINDAGFATSSVFSSEEIAELGDAFEKRLRRSRYRLEAREAAGKVRCCHGDLHLRNICMINGEPVIFDCIEFNDDIATADVLYDLAFLLMDLWHRGLDSLANLVTNRYLDETEDDDGFVLLPFFMAVRAAVRAHVIATHADLVRTARSYFDLAWELLKVDGKHLIAIGGLSGSGKSTIAEALAPKVGIPPGARVLESDRLRKAIFGKSPRERLGAEAYSPEISRRVYRELLECASRITADQGTVVVDATFTSSEDRMAVELAARKTSAGFTGIWLQADPAVLRQRIVARRGGASDATVDVLEKQLTLELGDISWEAVDTGESIDGIVCQILKVLEDAS